MILKIHHVFKSDYHKLRVNHLFSPDLLNDLLASFSLFRNILYTLNRAFSLNNDLINRAFSLNNDLIRSFSHLKLPMAPLAYRRKLKSTEAPSHVLL